MDEVGFMVRSIFGEGAIDVLPVGNVRMEAWWLVASSSGDVGLCSGQTAAHAVAPDLAIVLDTACWVKIFDYGATNSLPRSLLRLNPALLLFADNTADSILVLQEAELTF